MTCVLEQQLEFGSMELKAVDLLVAQEKTANDRVCVKKFSAEGA